MAELLVADEIHLLVHPGFGTYAFPPLLKASADPEVTRAKVLVEVSKKLLPSAAAHERQAMEDGIGRLEYVINKANEQEKQGRKQRSKNLKGWGIARSLWGKHVKQISAAGSVLVVLPSPPDAETPEASKAGQRFLQFAEKVMGEKRVVQLSPGAAIVFNELLAALRRKSISWNNSTRLKAFGEAEGKCVKSNKELAALALGIPRENTETIGELSISPGSFYKGGYYARQFTRRKARRRKPLG